MKLLPDHLLFFMYHVAKFATAPVVLVGLLLIVMFSDYSILHEDQNDGQD